LTWHGDDYIKALSDHFADKDDIFPILIRKWLLGAVGRILGPRPGQQHPMLVLDGPQGIGKSRFVWWLGTPLPAFYTQSAINTDDKDFQIRLCSTFVWEVEELGATFRKSDLESLKSFLSREIVKVRVPYGKRDIVKPATASFIGTLNNSGGFLNDPTGNRRFRTCTITYIDWDYDKLIDINQVWAQAVALFQAGETYELDVDTQRRIVEISERYEVDDPIAFDVLDSFNVDPYAIDQSTPTATIIHRLRGHGSIIGGSDQQIANRIGNVLTKFGCESGRQHVNGHQVRVWRGVWLKV
jgi:predicted P-loop ATPase